MTITARYTLIAFLAAAVACGGTTDDNDGDTPPADAPRILEFTTDVATITLTTDGDPVIRFSLIATDPDGIDDIIGVSLKSADEQKTFGVLATTGQEGAYSTQLTWSAVNKVLTIDGPQVATIRFVAVVFDVAGNQAKASVEVDFSCGTRSVCGGTCTNVRYDTNHCGGCNNACGRFETCAESSCALAYSCDPLDFFPDALPCDGTKTCIPNDQGFSCLFVGTANLRAARTSCATGTCAQGSLCGNRLSAPYTTSVCQPYCNSVADCLSGEDCINIFTAAGFAEIPTGGEHVNICVP